MLAKKFRLPVEEVISRKAAVTRGELFTVKVFTSQLPYSRFGVVVSSRIIPKATKRNALRRLIFNWLRTNQKTTGHSHDVVLIATPALGRAADKSGIIKELENFFSA